MCVFLLFCVDIQTEKERLFATERERKRERESIKREFIVKIK